MPIRMADKAGHNSGERATARRQPPRNAKANGATAEGPAGNVEPSAQPSAKIDRLIAGIPDWRGNVLATIRRIMLEADPSVTEDWKWMGSPVWYCDGIVSLANPHRDKVKWTFSKGAHFADPGHLFNAGLGGNEWRAIDIFENDRPNEAALSQLVKTAIAYNRSQLKDKHKSKVVEAATRKARTADKADDSAR